MVIHTLIFVMIVGGIKRRVNTIKKIFSSFGKINYPKNLLTKNGPKNIKNQLTVITQKVLVKERIVRVEKKEGGNG
jgi:hypothetical protein